MEFILIPSPGEFLMGSDDQQLELLRAFSHEQEHARMQASEQPQRRVLLTKLFWMGATEVTIGQFRQFSQTGYQMTAERNPAEGQRLSFQNLGEGVIVSDDLPAGRLSWDDAVAFCDWLTRQPAGLAGNGVCRLPTEAEWEYACRAGTQTLFSFGNDHRRLTEYGWFGPNSDRTLHAVGSKRPNPFGLFDMHGNVGEWCRDFYTDETYRDSLAIDPTGPATSGRRVIRGGHPFHGADLCRSAHRGRDGPQTVLFGSSFRVVRTLDLPPSPPLWQPTPEQQAFFDHVSTLAPEQQVEAVRQKLVEVNPGYDGSTLVHKMVNGKVYRYDGNAKQKRRQGSYIQSIPSKG